MYSAPSHVAASIAAETVGAVVVFSGGVIRCIKATELRGDEVDSHVAYQAFRCPRNQSGRCTPSHYQRKRNALFNSVMRLHCPKHVEMTIDNLTVPNARDSIVDSMVTQLISTIDKESHTETFSDDAMIKVVVWKLRDLDIHGSEPSLEDVLDANITTASIGCAVYRFRPKFPSSSQAFGCRVGIMFNFPEGREVPEAKWTQAEIRNTAVELQKETHSLETVIAVHPRHYTETLTESISEKSSWIVTEPAVAN